MSQSKTKNAAEDLMASLMEELNLSANNSDQDSELLTDEENDIESSLQGLVFESNDIQILDSDKILLPMHGSDGESADPDMAVFLQTFENTAVSDMDKTNFIIDEHVELDAAFVQKLDANEFVHAPIAAEVHENLAIVKNNIQNDPTFASATNMATVAIAPPVQEHSNISDNDKTVAIAGYTNRNVQGQDEPMNKISVGQSRAAFSSGYAAWGNSDSQLAQAENLRIAQDKILEIEKENDKLRLQNEELMSASEIVKERADLLTAQVHEFKSDRDSLEQSYKNEMQLIRNQFHRKDNELQKAQMKIDELDSRLKFDMKKIRIRERELENRLELIRAEKNALVKSKDEQILDLRRKMDQVQLEVESYRQKCVDLNKVLDTNQDSFKRTTRALRLAMANLELQDENKFPLKKVD